MSLARNLRMMVKSDVTQSTYMNALGFFGNDVANNWGTKTVTQVIRNTASGSLTLTGVSVSGTTATYSGTITGGGTNNFQGFAFTFAGFAHGGDNGIFVCTSNTTAVIVVTAINHRTETIASTAVSATTTTTYLISDATATNNAWVGRALVFAGFSNGGNNGTFSIIASDSAYTAVSNSSGVNETATKTAYPSTSTGNTFNLTSVIKQTAQTFSLTSVSGSNTFNGTITGGAANAYTNWVFLISGFTNPQNNGYFMITTSTAATLVVATSVLVNETAAGSAISSVNTTSYVGTVPSGVISAAALHGGQAESVYTITGCTNSGNNATLQVLASSATAFGATNSSGVTETPTSNAAFATGVSGMSWALQQSGYTNTNDGGQVVWNTVSFSATLTTANGNAGNGTVTYTFSVTPNGIRVGQVLTVTGTTNFNGSFVITAINTGAKTVNVSSTNANTTESGLTATARVLAGTCGAGVAGSGATPLNPGVTQNSLMGLYNVSGAAPAGQTAALPGGSGVTGTQMVLKFQGVWSPTTVYQGPTLGTSASNTGTGPGHLFPAYGFHDLVWNSSTDPNCYLAIKRTAWNIISASCDGTTATYVLGTQGDPGTGPVFLNSVTNNIVANEHVTITGCTTAALNVTNALVTGVTTTGTPSQLAIQVKMGTSVSLEAGPTSALMAVVPTITGNATQDTATLTHWIPFMYEMFQSNDGLTTYYLKLEYGQGATNGTSMTVTYGAGTDGNGTLTTPSMRFALGSNSGPSNTTLHEFCFFGTGSGANFAIMGPRDVANPNMPALIWVTERGKSSAGADQSNYVTVVGGYGIGSGVANWFQNSLILAAAPYNNITANIPSFYTVSLGGGAAVVPQGVFSIGISANLGGWRSGIAGSANVPMAPVFPNVGFFDNPLTMLCGTQRGPAVGVDTLDNSTFTMTMYGSTRTYLMTDFNAGLFIPSFPSVTLTQRGFVAIRWEA